MSLIQVRSSRPWTPTRSARQDNTKVTYRFDYDRLLAWRMRLWRDACAENGIKVTAKRERDMLAQLAVEVAAIVAAQNEKNAVSS